MIALLYKAPRTAPELAELTGMSRSNIVLWLAAFMDEGLIEKIGVRKTPVGGSSRIYQWSTE